MITIYLNSCVYKISKDSKCCFNKFDYKKLKYTIVFREFNFSLAETFAVFIYGSYFGFRK